MENKIWDVVVIGGGPAGTMAAGRAVAELLFCIKDDTIMVLK